MFCVRNQSGNVPPPHQTCPVVASMHDEAWNVEWGMLRPLYKGMGAWHSVQRFGGSCQTVQEQSISVFHDDEEACAGEDEYEPDQTASCGLVLELPSIGSKDHAIGECKRCAFFFKGRCRNGKECSHCHLPHEETRRKRNRRKAKDSAVKVEDNDDYEGDLDDDVDEMTQPPAGKMCPDRGALLGTPVHLPAKTCCEGFDSMLVFGSVTPELQPQVGSAAGSCVKTSDEDDEEACGVPAAAFSSLWTVNEKTSSSPHVKADSVHSDVQSIASDEEVSQLEEMEAEAARLEEEALNAEKEAQQFLEEALAAKEQYIEKPNKCIYASFSHAAQVPEQELTKETAFEKEEQSSRAEEGETTASSEENRSDASGVTGHETAQVSESEVTKETAFEKEEQSSRAEEGETTASSEENRSDASGVTGHDFSSNCSDKADSTSSDSDAASPQDIKPTVVLPKEMGSQRQERRQYQSSHKQVSDAVRSPMRSPLWPSCSPATETPDSEVSKAASPCAGEPQKEKSSWAALARARRQAAEVAAKVAAEDADVERKTSWMAQSRIRQRAAAEDPDLAVVRQARGILNKLTDTNFETLYQQLLGCGIRSTTQLEALVMEIFEKATTQHGFLPMYVKLCDQLNGHFEEHPIEGANFRKVLVGACQRTFEKTLRFQPEVDKDLSYEDRYEIELKFKTRMLGNLRFVGELLVRKLLAGKVLLAVSEELLSVGDGASIEAAATLLKVAGPAFDRKSWVFLPRLHAIFSMLRCISKDKAVPMRVRCILKDLLELRDAGWQQQK